MVAREMMYEEARSIPVAGEFDICVIGGSCTGVFAAARAAQLGARVAIVEANGFFGGVATAGLVNIWHSIHSTTGDRQIIGGLTVEVVERLLRRDAASAPEPPCSPRYSILATPDLIMELDRMVMDAGVRPFLHTVFANPLLKDGQLVAVAVEDKSGRRCIKASYFIDATGDGDLVARMGLPWYGRTRLQPPTTCAIVRGIKGVKQKNPDFSFAQEVYNPSYPQHLERGFLWYAPVPGSVDDTMLAGTRIFNADCSDADQLTRAEIEGRRQVRAICDILRENFLPAGVNPLVALPARLGIRESRHAVCLHSVSEQEVLTGVRFPDAIANGTYRVDVHQADGPGIIFRYLDGREEFATSDFDHEWRRWRPEMAQDPTFYQIPYRALVPKGATNTLVAGRCLDADEGAFGALRVMVNCNQTGEAAGTAAYLSLAGSIPVSDVDPAKLRQTMASQGSIVI